jgi:hypothetical protein
MIIHQASEFKQGKKTGVWGGAPYPKKLSSPGSASHIFVRLQQESWQF